MSVTTVLILALSSFLAISFGVLPLLRRSIEKDLTSSVILPYARYHLFAILRTVSLTTAMGAAAVLAIIGYLDMRGIASVEEVSRTLELARNIRDFAAKSSTDLSVFVFFLLSGGLSWLSFKQAKQRATKLFESIRAEERERVLEAYKNEQWESLPPTETMTKIEAIFEGKQVLLKKEGEAGDTKQIEALKEELDDLRGAYLHFDIERRLNVQLKASLAEDLVLPITARLADRVRNAILNRGVLKSLQGASKVLVFVMLVALLPSAATVDFGVGLRAFEDRLVKLDELRVTLSREEADRLLKQALANPATPKAVSVPMDDSTAEEQIAAAYHHAFTQHLLGRALTTTALVRLNHSAVREQILRDFAQASPHNLEAVAGPDALGEPHPLEQARQKVRSQIEAIRRENALAWKSMKAAVPTRADFLSQVVRSDLRQALTGEVFKTAFSGNLPDLAGAYEAYASQYLSSLSQGGSFQEAGATFARKQGTFWTAQTEERLNAIQQHVTGEGDMLDRAVRDNPPTLHNRPPPPTEVEEVERILQSIPERARAPEALYGYQDLLPGRLGDETRTAAANIAESLGPAGRSEGKPVRGAPKASKVAFERSFNYRSLRGFSRVGGVLIGRPPENDDGAADVVDFAWAAGEGDTLTLSLVVADGETHKFGPFPISLVRQALAYSADQRPLAVTMITAKPIPDLKIITHPALIDTPVGCRAVMLDRVTDEATSRSEYRRRAETVARASNALYGLAWGITMSRLVVHDPRLSPEDRRVLERHSRRLIADASRELLRGYVGVRSALDGSEETPVSAKQSFYDPSVAQVGSACAKKSESFEKLDACIRASSTGGDLKALLTHLPEFQIWSGVREQPYKIDRHLSFLRAPAGNELWPFDFVLQTAFTRQGIINSDEVRDDTPWEFPALHQRLVHDVGTLIKGNPARLALLKEMQNFTVVQRLFRVAMNGQLGTRFPVAKLGVLSRELNAKPLFVNAYKTPRWNTRDVETLYATIIAQVVHSGELRSPKAKELAKSAIANLAGCVARARKSGSAEIGVACNLDGIIGAAKLVEDDATIPPVDRGFGEEIREMAGVLQLRRTLGVLGTENLGMATCPAL